MSRILGSIFAAVVVAAVAFGGVARAENITAGDYLKLADGPGGGNGGEFKATLQSGSYPTLSDTSTIWYTFCMEKDEYFSPGEALKVAGVGTTAQAGGVNTNSGDELDARTAWLYTQMRYGGLVGLNSTGTGLDGTYLGSGFNSSTHVANATWLQKAIWFIEGEGGTSNYYVTLADAAIAAGWTGTGYVKVLNLQRKDSNGNWVNAQDQLALITPEPMSLALVGAGLAAFRLSRRRRKSS